MNFTDSGLLAGFRVVNLAVGYAGRFAGAHFARHGATLIDSTDLRQADVAIVSCRADARRLLEAGHRLVVGLVEDFAGGGPYQNWTGCELILQALSGSMYCTGLPGRPPLYGAGQRTYFAAGLYLYIGVCAALIVSKRGGQSAQLVSVSAHEAAVSMEQNFTTQWQYSSTIDRRGERHRPKLTVRCKDGWAAAFAVPTTWRALLDTLGRADLLDDPRFATWSAFLRNLDALSDSLDAGTPLYTRNELLDRALASGVVLAPVLEPGELLTDSALLERGFWRGPAENPQLGPLLRITPPHLNATDGDIRTGEGEAAEWSSGPLTGVRVLDFSTAWSGPMAARVLGYLGADVLKVEGPSRPDGWRGDADPAIVRYYPDRLPGNDPLNRHCWFNTQNTNKRSVVVDLKDERGRWVIERLARTCDVVLANFTPGTLERLGLGPDRLSRLRPEIVMLEMPAYGDTGALAGLKGLGPTMEAMSGISSLIGYPAGSPLGSGTAYLDPMGGLVGAAGVVTALLARCLDGRGRRVEVAQREAAMHWIGEYFAATAAGTPLPSRCGNDVVDAYPHDAYPAAGDDEWIAIAVFRHTQWKALCDLAGWTRWRADDGFGTVEARRSRSAEIDAQLSRWTSGWDKAKLARRLQSAGVPAAPVCNGRDLFSDGQLRARRWYVRLEHPSAGAHEYPRLPIELSATPGVVHSPAPKLGQHTYPVLRQLGWSDPALRAMARDGVITCAGWSQFADDTT